MSPSLNVSEVFYSIQGEGQRAGTANIFIRLQGCKAKHACYASGIMCDTEFESGQPYTLDHLFELVNPYPSMNIIWTGGEPLDQLTEEMIDYFTQAGYYQAIETSGLHPVPPGIDYVVLSPKVAEHVCVKNFPEGVDELRYVRHAGQHIPSPSVRAKYYCLSPHSGGYTINDQNLTHCINLVKQFPEWRLSVQLHKLWQVL